MIELLILGTAAGGCGAAYLNVRRFVRRRLRFVDAVQRRGASVVVGVAGTLVAAPLVAILPVVGAGTAVLFGAGAGLAVRHGAKDIRLGRGVLPPG